MKCRNGPVEGKETHGNFSQEILTVRQQNTSPEHYRYQREPEGARLQYAANIYRKTQPADSPSATIMPINTTFKSAERQSLILSDERIKNLQVQFDMEK